MALALLASLVELLFGYPDRLFRRIGHPVVWIGQLISALDRRWNRGHARIGGVGLVLVLLTIAAVAGIVGAVVPWVVVGVAASSLLAQRSLYTHVVAVADALELGLPQGRVAVSQIVGRDPEALDQAGVARAAIESLAENYSDGVVAPLLWLAVAGVGGGVAYKAVNTADSMVGHMNDRYRDFGWAAARLDDVMNLPASRLAAVILTAAAWSSGGDARGAWRAVLRDARRHRSPNAGWPEAAMAGALGVGLAGPRAYDGVMTDDPVMNDGGRRDLDAGDIRRALRIYRHALVIQNGALLSLALLL